MRVLLDLCATFDDIKGFCLWLYSTMKPQYFQKDSSIPNAMFVPSMALQSVIRKERERGRFYYYYYYYCGSTLLLGFDNDIPHLTVFLFTQLNPLLIVPTSYVLHVAHISQIQLASNPSIQNPVDAICLM